MDLRGLGLRGISSVLRGFMIRAVYTSLEGLDLGEFKAVKVVP
jgi:hypothetical protein